MAKDHFVFPCSLTEIASAGRGRRHLASAGLGLDKDNESGSANGVGDANLDRKLEPIARPDSGGVANART